MAILLEPLRVEFALSDTQLGLLSGTAFALFYATLGIPIARLADRFSRVSIISIALALWSFATAACGAAQSFLQLFLARVAVGVGEAGGGPPSHSLIGDYFEVGRRSFAMAVFNLGTSLGAVGGLVLGGYIADSYGWRWAFVAAGAPGVALAIIVKLTLREPERGKLDESLSTNNEPSRTNNEHIRIRDSIRELWANLVYRRALFGMTFNGMVGYGLAFWLAPLYVRQFDLSLTTVGAIVGGVNITCVSAGMLFGGYIADRYAARDPRWRIRIPAIALVVSFPFYLCAFWQNDVVPMTVLFGLGLFANAAGSAAPLSMVQIVVRPRIRAEAAAYVFFFINIFGLGVSPLIVGYISDASQGQLVERSLNVALSAVILFLIPACYYFWRAGDTLESFVGSVSHDE